MDFAVNLKTALLAFTAAAALIGAAVIGVPSSSDHTTSFRTEQAE